MSSIPVRNFRSRFCFLDNENKMSAFQMLAISLLSENSHSLHCKRDSAVSVLLQEALDSIYLHAPLPQLPWALDQLPMPPHPAQRNAHAKKPPNYTTLPAALQQGAFSPISLTFLSSFAIKGWLILNQALTRKVRAPRQIPKQTWYPESDLTYLPAPPWYPQLN